MGKGPTNRNLCNQLGTPRPIRDVSQYLEEDTEEGGLDDGIISAEAAEDVLIQAEEHLAEAEVGDLEDSKEAISVSHLEEQTEAPLTGEELKRELAENYGNGQEKQKAMAKSIGKGVLGALAGSAGAAIAFGTPLLPVAGLALSGYLAAKAYKEYKDDKKNSESAPQDAQITQDTAPQDIAPQEASLEGSPQEEISQEIAEADAAALQENVEDVIGEYKSRLNDRAAKEAEVEAQRQAKLEELQAIALENAQTIQDNLVKEASENIDKEIVDELREEGVRHGKDFGAKVDPEAIEARKIFIASRAWSIHEDEKEAVVRAVSETEAAYLSQGPLKERLKELEDAEKVLEKEAKAAKAELLAQKRDEIKEMLSQRKEALKAERNHLQARDTEFSQWAQRVVGEGGGIAQESLEEMQAIKNRIAEIDNELSNLPEAQKYLLEQQKEAVHAAVEERKRDPLARIRAEKAGLLNPGIGDVDGLVNLTTRSDGSLACGRCGRRPKTVRLRCSKCGSTFIIEKKYQKYIGNSDEQLSRKGKLDLVEKYEGTAEQREYVWSEWQKGKRIRVPKEESEESTSKKASSKKESLSSSKTKKKGSSNTAVKNSSTLINEKLSPIKLHQRLQPKGDYDRVSYLEQQKSLRSGDNPERRLFVQGIGTHKVAQFAQDIAQETGGSFTPDSDMMISQTKAILSGVQEWEWNTTASGVRPGDRIFIRSGGKIVGYYDVAEHFSIHIPEDAKSEEFDRVVDDTWERVKDGLNDGKYYTKEALRAELYDRAVNPRKEKTLYFSKISNAQPLKHSDPDLRGQVKGGGVGPEGRLNAGTACINDDTLSPDEGFLAANPERTEKLARAAEENDARLIEENSGKYPGEGFGLDKKGEPQVCGVKTSDGHPCRRAVKPLTKFCWQHQGGPRKGESRLSAKETKESQEALRKSWEQTPLSAASSDQSGQDIVTVARKEDARTFAPVNDQSVQSLIDSQNKDPEKSETLAVCGMTEHELAHYANAWLDGLHPSEDDTVIIEPTKEEHLLLAEMAAKIAFKRKINFSVWGPDGDDEENEERYRETERNGQNMIFAQLLSVDGPGLAGGATEYGELINKNGIRWSVTFMPTRDWADRLDDSPHTGFADCDNPLRQLANDLQDFTYSDQEGGLPAHIGELDDRAERMERVRREKGVERIQITGEGTDLEMELTDSSVISSVDMKFSNEAEKTTLANTATEEIYATPVAGSVNGKFQSSTPLTLDSDGAEVVEGVRGRFENGELVELEALRKDESGNWVPDAEGQAALAKYFGCSEDGPWPGCGEVGMLDSKGRVAQTGRRYLTPMIDEHGGLHIAIGHSYASNGGGIENGATASDLEYHLDITIGDPSTSVIGHTKSGEQIAFMSDSEWQDF